MHIILGRTSARCQRALQTKEFNRLPNHRLADEMQKNMKRGQEIVRTRKYCVDTCSAEAYARAAERGMTITTVRVTPSDRGLDSCLFPDPVNVDQPMEAEVAAEEADKCNNCTCHTVKLCRDVLRRGTLTPPPHPLLGTLTPPLLPGTLIPLPGTLTPPPPPASYSN